ncbi:chemotaxis signal transduction protein [Pseudomonas psychrotolerans]|nr:chemotaxis signal transduction protein [Pseudomonas psychrotolerans]
MKKTSAQGSEDPVLQWVTFRLDNETYGINVMQVQEVLRYTEIAPVPGAPSYVLGIINLRGNVVTVIDTRQRFGLLPTEVTDNTRIVPHHRGRQAGRWHPGGQRGRSGLSAAVGDRDGTERG